ATIRQVSAWALDNGGQLLAAREIDVLESEQTRTKLEQVIIQRDQSRFDTPGWGEGIARHQVMPDEAYERRMGLREHDNIVPPEEVQRVRGAIERQSGFDSRPQGQAYARGAPLNSRPLTIELDTEQLAGLFEQIAADEAVTVVMDSQNMARAQVAYDSLQDRDAIAGARRTLTRHTEMAVPPAESESPLDRANGRPSGALTPEVPIESTPPPAQTGERMADARGRPAIMSESERPGLDIARGRVQSTITMENGGLVGSLRMNAAHWQRVVQHAALNQRFIGDHWHAEDAGMGGAAGGLSLENGRSVDLEREKADLRDVPAPGDAPRARPGVGADPITEPPAPTTDTDRAGAGLEAQDTAVAPRRLADTETGGSRAGGIAELRSRVADSQSQHGRRSGRNVIVEVLVIPRQQVDELIEAQRRIENR
ncbi:MAG: hypothetical protein JJU36_02780, partial [Phycisphaeraceae bacterium]|nr:hypothetical protein [Phycisphaeraceae bacterium]